MSIAFEQITNTEIVYPDGQDMTVHLCELHFDFEAKRRQARLEFNLENGTLTVALDKISVHMPTIQLVIKLLEREQESGAEVSHAQVH